MKIILAPSKTQDFSSTRPSIPTDPVFIKKANTLANKLKRMSKSTLGETMSIKDQLLEETYANYKNFSSATSSHAIDTYIGLVYKYMNLSTYNAKMLDYLDQHLRILSALYGVLKPFDGIKPYRLDMKMSMMKTSLYDYWQKDMLSYFEGETIIDLASTEFSKMIPLPKTTIGFRDYKKGSYKNLATYSKMARGMLLDYMITNHIEMIDDLKSVEFEGYHYNQKLSSDSLIIYSRYD